MQGSKIHLLNEQVINQIAAGEVIERPNSIVRELVDNALDAGACSVEITLEEGGQALIRVRDDGQGMSPEDAEICFKRHATSKIKKIEDLDSIQSLGFRGEALSSIAAVARVQLRTRQIEAEIGCEIIVEEGQIISSRPWSGSNGTEFEVSRLFFYLPARRKFLKSARADLIKTVSWLYSSALAHPNIKYRLLSGATEILFLSPHSDIFARLESLMSGSTIRVDYQAGPFSVKGLLAHPAQVETKLDNTFFLVNSRPVNDRLLVKSLRDAWSTGLRPGEFPIGALQIELPASEVDINVHPQKSEVRFRNPQAVFGSFYKAIKLALADWSTPISQQHFESKVSSQPRESESFRTYHTQQQFAEQSIPTIKSSFFQSSTSEELSSFDDQTNSQQLKVSMPSEIKFLGQILGVFLLFEVDAKVFLLDAHAAHERIRFNELIRWTEQESKPSQFLLFPETYDFSEEIRNKLIERAAELLALGLEIKEQAGKISVLRYPTSLKLTDLRWFLELSAESEDQDFSLNLRTKIEQALARQACRSSVMSGELLSAVEATMLWNRLASEKQSAVCPHGRPVMVELTRKQLDAMFLRDGFAGRSVI